MKQKPILFLSAVLISAFGAFSFTEGIFKNLGFHPKNVNLPFFNGNILDLNSNVADQNIISFNALFNQSISCPPNVIVGNYVDGRKITGGRSGLTWVDIPFPTTNVNFGNSTLTNDYNFTEDASDFYPLGITDVCWTAVDVTGNTEVCCIEVRVVDITPPNITCPANIRAQCEEPLPYEYYTEYLLAGGLSVDETAIDTSTFDWVSDSTDLRSCPETIYRKYKIGDTSSNFDTCTQVIVINDTIPPNAICKNVTVYLDNNGQYIMEPHEVNNGSTDNCNRPLSFSGSPTFFACNDAISGVPVPFNLIVTDNCSNTSSCMAIITVRDSIKPVIINPLPDISISCEFPLNLNDLNVFGTFVLSGAPRQNIVINDVGNPFYPTGIAGQSGVYTENCLLTTVSVSVRNQLNMCNVGKIYRDFVVKDNADNKATFTQTINVIDIDKFDISDITWPAENIDYNNCNITNPPVSITGSPALNNDKCSRAAATSSDQTFSHPIHCKYIRRTWTVIDWCQYKTNTTNSPGKWTFIQNIYIKNTVAPTIDVKVCRDTVICNPLADCSATVTFNATGKDDCLPVNIRWSYKIDINDNGGVPEFVGMGATVTRLYPMGTHRLTWEAKDGCSNISTCSFRFTVRDCKAPAAIAKNGLAINLIAPMAMSEIWATDFNNFSNDNCTPTPQLKFSFSSNINDNKRTFNCDSLGIRKIELWVTDLAGNQSKAVTFISVQDNHGLCPGNRSILISGNIYTEEKGKVPDTKINIDGGETERALMTNDQGSYTFDDLAIFNDYQLLPIKDDNYTDGITTLDLVLIQRHILGFSKLESPYKLIAADANNSKSVTASDIVELRKLILGMNDNLSNNTSWRFVDANYTFSDASNPWTFAESIKYEGLESDMTATDFIAVKIGDVNGSVSENVTTKTQNRWSEKLNIHINDEMLKAGEFTNVPVMIQRNEGIVGLQWTFELSPGVQYFGIEAADLNVKNEHFAEITRNGKRYITFSYDDINGMKLDENAVMFYLILRSDKPGKISQLLSLNNKVIPALAYDINDQEARLNLEYRTALDHVSAFISQNHPNPFKDESIIKIAQKTAGLIKVSVFDVKGEQVYNSETMLPAGEHSITLNNERLGGRFGIFYCKIKTNELSKVIKMMRIE